MMVKLQRKHMFYFVAASFLIILVDLILVNSVLFKQFDQVLAIGMTLDFVVVIPLLLYLFVYRQKKTQSCPFFHSHSWVILHWY
ncbi:hypothetical protein [Paenibacillus sp. GCM10028914]|uniref:hypothetical protein n=1 Tax=Paenibacillus sp. GCM10028914 TaxID=3273416 RepID=UPI003611291C